MPPHLKDAAASGERDWSGKRGSNPARTPRFRRARHGHRPLAGKPVSRRITCARCVASSGVKNGQERESAISVKSRKSFVAPGIIGRSYLVGSGSRSSGQRQDRRVRPRLDRLPLKRLGSSCAQTCAIVTDVPMIAAARFPASLADPG